MNSELTALLSHFYPALRALSTQEWRTLSDTQRVVDLAPGKVVFERGKRCEYFPLLLEGSLRLQRLSNDGHEITLRHVHPGEICELASICLLAGGCYPVEAIAETPVRALLLSQTQFGELSKHQTFRRFLYASMDTGIESLLGLVEDIAFSPLDRRLAQCLLHLADRDLVRATHDDLAQELGTAREVVSRLLKDFERRQWLVLKRGRIEIRDRSALLAASLGSPM